MGRLTGFQRILTVAEFVEATADSTQPGNDLVMQGVLAGVELLFERVDPGRHFGELVAHLHEKLIFACRCGTSRRLLHRGFGLFGYSLYRGRVHALCCGR